MAYIWKWRNIFKLLLKWDNNLLYRCTYLSFFCLDLILSHDPHFHKFSTQPHSFLSALLLSAWSLGRCLSSAFPQSLPAWRLGSPHCLEALSDLRGRNIFWASLPLHIVFRTNHYTEAPNFSELTSIPACCTSCPWSYECLMALFCPSPILNTFQCLPISSFPWEISCLFEQHNMHAVCLSVHTLFICLQ